MQMTTEEFKSTVLPLKDRLFRLAFRYLRNREESRDAVQDVLLRFWERQTSSGVIRNVESMLVTMTKNRCLDLLRKSGRNAEQIEARYDLQDSQVLPDDRTEQNEMVARLREFLSELPAEQRRILRLRDFDEMTYEEIAAETGLSMSNVKVTLHRARKAVRAKMEAMYAYDTTRNRAL